MHWPQGLFKTLINLKSVHHRKGRARNTDTEHEKIGSSDATEYCILNRLDWKPRCCLLTTGLTRNLSKSSLRLWELVKSFSRSTPKCYLDLTSSRTGCKQNLDFRSGICLNDSWSANCEIEQWTERTYALEYPHCPRVKLPNLIWKSNTRPTWNQDCAEWREIKFNHGRISPGEREREKSFGHLPYRGTLSAKWERTSGRPTA